MKMKPLYEAILDNDMVLDLDKLEELGLIKRADPNLKAQAELAQECRKHKEALMLEKLNNIADRIAELENKTQWPRFDGPL